MSTDIDNAADEVTISLTDTTVSGIASVLDGAGIAVTITESLPAGPIAQTVLEPTTVEGNTSAAGGGGIYSESGDLELNSTVSGNTAAIGAGNIVVPDHQLRLAHATVVDGNGSGADNIDVQTFDGFGSIIATPGGVDRDCVFGGLASRSVSVAGDGSCGAAVTGNPVLAALADNGGATQTPAAGGRKPGAGPRSGSGVHRAVDRPAWRRPPAGAELRRRFGGGGRRPVAAGMHGERNGGQRRAGGYDGF